MGSSPSKINAILNNTKIKDKYNSFPSISSNSKLDNKTTFLVKIQTDNFEIKDKENISTQTNSNLLEENDEINGKKKRRKYLPDLIRDKIFKNFNKMLFNWINSSKNKNDNINIIQYSLKKNNKENISQAMNKLLKELFVLDINDINQIDNELLKQKLELKYEDVYKIFISDHSTININEELFKNFSFLNDFLRNLEKTEKEDYINKVKEIALRYDDWKNKKIHLFKK